MVWVRSPSNLKQHATLYSEIGCMKPLDAKCWYKGVVTRGTEWGVQPQGVVHNHTRRYLRIVFFGVRDSHTLHCEAELGLPRRLGRRPYIQKVKSLCDVETER